MWLALPWNMVHSAARLQSATTLGSTVSRLVAALLSLVAVMVTVPSFSAETFPFASTLAVSGSELAHVTLRPVNVPPAESWTVAVSWRLCVAYSAPLAGDGHVNVSPKGLDTFRVLGPRRVAYLDLTGSGNETAAHLA